MGKFIESHIVPDNRFSAQHDVCDRGIHYVRVRSEMKQDTLALMQALEKENIGFELLPFDLEDIIYSRYSKSVCDKVSYIDLSHLSQKSSSIGFFRGFQVAIFLFLKKLMREKQTVGIQLLGIPAILFLALLLTHTKSAATFIATCANFIPVLRCLSLGYLTNYWNEAEKSKSRYLIYDLIY